MDSVTLNKSADAASTQPVKMSARDVKVFYGAKRALHGVNVDIYRNEVLALMWSDNPQNNSDSKLGVLQYDGARCQDHAVCKDWLDKVKKMMPRGAGGIVVDSATRMITISVSWQHGSEDTHQYTMRSRIAEASKQ